MTQLKDKYINNGLDFPTNFADMSIAEIERDLAGKVRAAQQTGGAETTAATMSFTDSETGETKSYDLSTLSGLKKFREDGGTISQARSALDQIEGLSQTTIETKLSDAGYNVNVEAAKRVNEVENYLNKNAGEDLMNSHDQYLEALKKWAKRGGDRGSFFTAFPPSKYLNPDELKQLPSNLYNTETGETTVEDLANF